MELVSYWDSTVMVTVHWLDDGCSILCRNRDFFLFHTVQFDCRVQSAFCPMTLWVQGALFHDGRAVRA